MKNKTRPRPSPVPQLDPEAAAIAARARRIAACEREVFAALAPILQAHHCRLGTIQEIVDGRPGPVTIRVFSE